jgi:hypothetical protein
MIARDVAPGSSRSRAVRSERLAKATWALVAFAVLVYVSLRWDGHGRPPNVFPSAD